MEILYAFGIALIQALQSLSPALESPMNFFTFMGTVEFYLLLVPLIYWTVDPVLGARVFFALLTTDMFSSYFKQLLHEPRPYWIGPVKVLGEETSYGIPSSHSSDSLAVWGTLAAGVHRGWMWVLAVFLILMIALSRLYLGVHFPQDVLGGWLIGLIVVIAMSRLERPLLAWLGKLVLGVQLLAIFLASAAAISLGFVVLDLISAIPDPPAWASYAALARTPEHYFTLGGALFGAGAGLVLARRYTWFQVGGLLGHKLLRYLLGIAGVLVIYLGLDAAFAMLAQDASTLGYILRYLRYAAVSLWVVCGAPWAFLKLHLALPGKTQLN